jgi:acetolactate synthase regulatory subunit
MAVLQHRGFRVCWVSSVEELERNFAEWGLLS